MRYNINVEFCIEVSDNSKDTVRVELVGLDSSFLVPRSGYLNVNESVQLYIKNKIKRSK